jgi:hypothetical protein
MSVEERALNYKAFLDVKDKLIRVDWVDIVCSAGWSQKGSGITPPHGIHSYGYLSEVVSDDILGDYITVSASLGVNGNEEYNQHITIPIGCVRKFEVLV